ncbi:MAG: hypothetical protein HYX48_07225 [Chlamydiales bacterium]|nr:hypothetical protein [Chlamydiales bacterium]
MRVYLSKMLALLICASPMALQAASSDNGMVKGKVIQFLLDTDSKGNKIPYLIDAKGKKIKLTMGTLINATAEAWMDGGAKNGGQTKLDPNAIAMFRLDRDGNSIQARLFDKDGREEPLNLGNLLCSAAQAYPGCTAQEMDGQTVNLPLAFELDDDGYIQGYLAGPDKEPFNLGVMFRETILMLNKCNQ